MLGLYFSGTGNSKYCLETFIKEIQPSAKSLSIEDPQAIEEIKNHETLVFAYPVYFSSIPKIVHDFIVSNKDIFKGKNIYIIASQGLFSGDGAGCGARLFEKYSAKILGGLHVRMPDSISDSVFLKTSHQANIKMIKRANEKIVLAAKKFKEGKAHRQGLGLGSRLAGLLVQRLWFRKQTLTYKSKPDVNSDKCIGCGLCVKTCPMNNMAMDDTKAVSGNRCTLCYRCVNTCPTQALTILGRKIHGQYLFKNNFK